MSVGEFFKKHLDSISTSYTNLDTEKADKLVELLSTCTGKIFFTGVGKNGHVAAKATSTFSSIGLPCFFLNPVDSCLLYTSPSPRDQRGSRMPSSA